MGCGKKKTENGISPCESIYFATIKASDTLEHQPTVWPVPYACAQPYHPGVAAMDSCFGLVRPHQHGVRVCHLLLLLLHKFTWHTDRQLRLIHLPSACRGRTAVRFTATSSHMYCVELALKGMLCTRLGSKGQTT